MDFRIPFSGRSHRYTKDELAYISEVIEQADTLTQGQYLHRFQQQLSDYIGATHVFALNNATSALEISAQMCQFQPGDEVIIPGHTFTASAYPFIKHGATVKWADIDLHTRVVTPETIEQCITSNTRAIVVVHLYGYGADMPAIMKLARKHDLLVIEDAAQALGVEIDGRKAGTFGDFGVYSFHSHKNITTLGEGGALVVRDQSTAQIIPQVRHNGHCSFSFKRDHYWIPAMGNVDMPELNGKPVWPNNYCIGEVECALGCKLIRRIDQMSSEKRQRALRFIDALDGYHELEFHREGGARHNYHLLVARFKNDNRDSFIQEMAGQGVQCVVQYYPLYKYDFYRKIGHGTASCPNTETFFDNMVSFPFHHMMSDDDFGFMIEATRSTLNNLS